MGNNLSEAIKEAKPILVRDLGWGGLSTKRA